MPYAFSVSVSAGPHGMDATTTALNKGNEACFRATPHRQIVPYLTYRPTIKPKQALRGKLGRGPCRGADTHTPGDFIDFESADPENA